MKVSTICILLFILIPISGFITAKLAALGWKRGIGKPKRKGR